MANSKILFQSLSNAHKFLWAFFFIFILVSFADAQQVREQINTAHPTRTASILSEYENNLLVALKKGDVKSSMTFLDESFQYVYTGDLNQSNSALEFVDKKFQASWKNSEISNLSVRTFDNNQITSFYLMDKPAKSQAGTIWVVQDFWKEINGSYKLQYRFISRLTSAKGLPPGYIKKEVTVNHY